MNCADARHRILTADLTVVRGESDASLREHLAGCSGCAADASRILGATGHLRTALLARQRSPQVRRSRERRIAMAVIPLALAAEITLIAVLTHRDAPASFNSPMLDSSITSSASVAAVLDTTMTPVATPIHVVARSRGAAESPKRDAIPQRDTATDDPSLSQVRVTVGQSQRAAIIATSNPRITVVWLSRGDSL